MRVKLLSLALITVVFAIAISGLESTTYGAFIQGQQPGQGGLRPEDKKKISTIDPGQVFGMPDENNRRSPNARPGGRPAPTPTPQSSRSQRSSSAVATGTLAEPSPQSSQSSPAALTAAAPSPTITAESVGNAVQQPSFGEDDTSDNIPSKWAAPVLISLALIVSVALIFTLTKLVEKIREGSSG
jgi:hypothetical protein